MARGMLQVRVSRCDSERNDERMVSHTTEISGFFFCFGRPSSPFSGVWQAVASVTVNMPTQRSPVRVTRHFSIIRLHREMA